MRSPLCRMNNVMEEKPIEGNADIISASSSNSTTINVDNLQAIVEDMYVSPTSSPDQLRICLVGTVVDDSETVAAAQSFGVPVIASETGAEYVQDNTCLTYFVMNDFEGLMFDAIHKSKHRILGPPALQQAVRMKEGLSGSNRPIYNYSMKGVITCFTGIRKKDELTRLVNLIHSMGGSIRKEMNSKVTHLICNASGGEKYRYAMTFRLAVVRPDWVYQAWTHRDEPNFKAAQEEFAKSHKLEAFEGHRICFFGFSSDEHDHMIDVLRSNGGISTTIDDPDCSHVIISNTGGNFPDHLTSSPSTSPSSLSIVSTKPHAAHKTIIESMDNKRYEEKDDSQLDNLSNIDIVMDSCDTTPKSSKTQHVRDVHNRDGIVLTTSEDNEFLNTINLSPILMPGSKSTLQTGQISPIELLDNIEEENSEDGCTGDAPKRKRDSFDDISLISTDSYAPSTAFNSAKKPKLIRTGSITRGLRRSMSFVAMKNPITNILRTRRNSVDPNSSINSITSIESTFNESIKKPIKQKLRTLKNRIIKSSCKREVNITPKCSGKIDTTGLNDESNFKTPIALPPTIATTVLNYQKIDDESKIETTSTGVVDVEKQRDVPWEKIEIPRIMINKIDHLIDTRIPMTESNNIYSAVGTNQQYRVVDEHIVQAKPEPKNTRTHIVKSDWFWYTIQNGFADEMDYLFGDYLESILNTPGADRRDSLPISFNKRKRKRFSQRTPAELTPLGTGKRRSSVSDAGLLSVSGSFLDYTASPSVNKHDIKDKETPVEHAPKSKSMRYNHFMDLFDTESNYVGILHTIVSLFHKPLESMADTADGLLNKSEVRAIFNNFSPIHDVHLEMLNRLHELKSDWSEDCLIGKIILDHREALTKAYPPYVNFFEQMKETLIQCDTQNPRFHAFLKINQAKPECGRQSLQDLMIRPVQRLPSISLLISDILKHTPKSNPDHKKLEEALKAIKEVMTYINEDKRKTEGRLALFDIFNDIDNCPPDLVSSHRNFISRCEVTELSNNLSGRDDPLMLFLFTDYMEVCKIKKSRGFNSAKSPGTTNGVNSTHRCSKPYKHIRLMPLNSIANVFDIKDSPRAFAIPNKDKLYSFNICDELDKIIYLKSLCKQLAENACRADADQFLRSYESHELGIDISDINLGTLKKAFNYARTRLKVTRAFSFNKTPLKLKRTISTTASSPLFGSTNSLTPATQLAQMKLASCTNINEIGEEEEDDDCMNSAKHNQNNDLLVAPMTVQPTRKSKSATLSATSLRRL